MGSSKRATVGYWYRLNLMFGLCRGPIDAFLEFRGGDRTAWAGELTESGTISINQPDLWGGEKSEGGIVGDCDVMFGTADQEKNAWALATFGEDQGAYRGRAVLAFKGGKYGAMNPYPKAASFKVRRIKKGWDNDECWYPEKAEIVTPDYAAQNAFGVSWRMVGTTPYTIENIYYTDGVASKTAIFNPRDGKRHTLTLRVRASVELRQYPGGVAVSGHVTKGGIPGDLASFNVYKLEISSPAATYYLNTGVSAKLAVFAESFSVEVDDGATITLSASTVDGRMVSALQTMDIDVPVVVSGGIFMNPAHALYDSITSRDMSGEPRAVLDDASFRSAADVLESEGFGICTTYDASAESIEDFQQRICNCIGGALSRDRRTGLWSLDLLRGDYTLSALPVLTDDDILDFTEEPSVLDDAVNQVVVEWFDPVIKEARSTAPVQSLGAITAFGGVVAETLKFPEIADETIALRVAARELRSRATPLRRFELKTNRVPYSWRPGTYFRLQAPKRGIADMVCLVGEIDVGTLRQGAITLTAVQDVFGMPSAVYVAAQAPAGVADNSPAISDHQRLIEVPYIEVVQMLSAADLDYLDEDVGFVAAVAGAPATGLNYSLMTGAEGESLQDRGSGDWTPVIVVSGAEGYAYLDVDITFDASSGLSLVTTPCAALWDDEIVRIDALDVDDAGAGTATLARGCADTVPQLHLASSVLYVFDVEAATDGRQYSAGEIVQAKLLTRVGGARLSIADAVLLSCELAGRWHAPYPPAALSINGIHFPADKVTGDVTLAWSWRNRLTQGDALIDWLDSSVTPEAGTSAELEVWDEDTDSLVYSQTGIAASPLTIASENVPYHARLKLWSARGGVRSMQAAQVSIEHGFEVTDNIVGAANLETYTATLTAQGIDEFVTWSVLDGSLPVGLHLASTAATTASISGVPNDADGVYSATIRAESGGSVVDREITINLGTIISLLHFDGSENGTTITDQSGRAWTRAGNAKTTSGGARFNQALELDGSGDYLTSLPNIDIFNQSITIEMWVNNRAQSDRKHLGRRAATGSTTDWSFGTTTDGKVGLFYWTGVTREVSGGSIPLNTLKHIALQNNNNVFEVLAHGEKVASAARVSGWSNTASDVNTVIGHGSSSGVNGWIDELRIQTGVRFGDSYTVPSAPSNYPQPAPLLAVKGSLPAGTAGATYNAASSISIHGAATPFSVSVSSGALPAGWTATVSGANVVVSGAGVSAGDYTFTLAVSDSASRVEYLPLTVRVL